MNQAYQRFLNTGLKASLGLFIALFAGQSHAKTEEAIFAGGCFWCMEEAFEKVKGVKAVESGYAGGNTPNPDYESISKGNTGHAEVVRVQYNAQEVSYSD
ncbi:MAG: peptide-methionine (S)-S-oxide reductase, partial [bacterium]